MKAQLIRRTSYNCLLFSCLVFVLGLSVSSCTLPMEPTASPTALSATDTPIAATATRHATSTPTGTATPTALPYHLDIDTGSLRGYTLLLWHAQQSVVNDLLETLAADFNQRNEFGIQVELVQFGSDASLVQNLREKKIDIPTPQMVLLDSVQNRKLGQEVQMTPLRGYYEHPLWGLEAQQITPITPQWLKDFERTNRLDALPLWEFPALLFYNDTFGRQLGFDSPPQTREELVNQMCAAAVAINNDDSADNNGTGGWIISGSADAFLSWIASRADLASAAADATLKQFGEQFAETLTWLQELKNQGCIWPSRLPDPYDYFASHQALVYSGTLADIKNQALAFSHNQANSADDWSLIPYPAISGSSQVLTNGVELSILMGTAEEQFASWLFLSWLLKGDNALRLAVAADGWPVQSDVTLDKAYREMTATQNYAALQYRNIGLPAPYPENWQVLKEVLSDGIGYFFSAYSKVTESDLIWEQIQETVNEIISQSP